MIVEDGTGIKDANSYASVEFADDYFSARRLGIQSGRILTAALLR